MRRSPHQRLASFALSLAGLLGGCGLTGEHLPSVDNVCADDSDCGAAACDPAASMCVTPPVSPMRLALEVVPASDPEHRVRLGAVIPDVEVSDGASTRDLVVPFAVPVVGTVRWMGVPVAAELTFDRESEIPSARAMPQSTSTFPLVEPTAPREQDFSIELAPNARYTLTVTPRDEFASQLPPLRAVLEVGATGQRVPIEYPEELAPGLELHGDIADLAGEPQVDLSVRAVEVVSGRTVSSVALTSDDGNFRIVVDRAASAWVLRITPTPERQLAEPTPSFDVDPAVLYPDELGWAHVLVPSAQRAVMFAGTVEYPRDGSARPVAGALMRLRSTDVVDRTTGIVGSYETTLTVDGDGRYSGHVLPGTYDVHITPTTDAELGVLAQQIAITRGTLGQVFHMPLRTVVSGWVQSPDGTRVTGARVRARALGWQLPGRTDAIAPLARSTESVTADMGAFRLPLDVGVYDIVIEPPDSSGFPWQVQRALGIGGSDTPLVRGGIELRYPVIVRGSVRWEDETALAGEVRAWGFVQDPETDAERAIEIGRASIAADGTYELVVPPTL